MPKEEDFDQRMRRIEELVREFEAGADPAARAKVAELVRLLMEFHGAAVERMAEIVAAAGAPGGDILDRFARDELVASLLLLYGLHPSDAETRVRAALDKVRPFLRQQGGEVELLGVEDGVVRLRLERGGHVCPSTAASLRLAVEEAVCDAAPEAVAVEVDGTMAQPPPSGLVQLERATKTVTPRAVPAAVGAGENGRPAPGVE